MYEASISTQCYDRGLLSHITVPLPVTFDYLNGGADTYTLLTPNHTNNGHN